MIRSIRYDISTANLEDLQKQLCARIAMLLICAGAFSAWAVLPAEPFPVEPFLLSLALLVIGITSRFIARSRPAMSRSILVLGWTAIVLVAMWYLPDSSIPLLAVFPIFAGALLTIGAELVTAAAIGMLAWWLASNGFRDYSIYIVLSSLIVSLVVAWLVVHIVFTALQWAWNEQRNAEQLLQETRGHQAAVSKALKSSETANRVLRRTERELVAARKQAETAQRIKEQFAANISHELRTPLNLILGFSEIMYLSPEVYGDIRWSPALRKDIYQVYHNSRHLLGLINDILDLSRFEIAGFTLNREPTPLEPLLRSTVDIVQDLFTRSQVELQVKIDAEIPVLDLDRVRLRQVLINLLDNAQRFTERGLVILEARTNDDDVVVSVTDTGPGISADELAHVFDDFYQVDRSLRRSRGGAGLGLAISKRFVEAHGGRIWAQSTPGHGTTFFVALPIPERKVPLSKLYVETPVDPPVDQSKASLLVIDQDPAVVDFVARRVEGYEVVQVKALEQLADAVYIHHPRAIIYNVAPDDHQDGTQTLPYQVPVIRCSLYSNTWVIGELDVQGFLVKPVTTESLLDAISRIGHVEDILILDDDRGFRLLIERILQASGRQVRVRHAYNGVDGIASMREKQPDLVLLDLIMPQMDGFQVLELMRGDRSLAELPVVVLTASNYGQNLADYRGSHIEISCLGGMSVTETVHCLDAIVGALPSRYPEGVGIELNAT
ncbi:MAG: response regulator [Caldilineaceae bacterium]|nr:response regulator [Caldilineaceae bacterium]